MPQSASDAVLFIDILGVWRRHIRRVAVVGTAAAVTTAAVATSSAEASAAASQAAAAQAAAARPPAPPPQPAAAKKLEQLKAMLNEGLITQAQYQKASQQMLNEVVQ